MGHIPIRRLHAGHLLRRRNSRRVAVVSGMTGRLNTIRIIAAAYADDPRNSPTRDERHARYVLTALCTAISHGSLDSLVDAIKPWMREQVALVDALSDGAEFDLLSAAVGEMGVADEDLDDAVGLRLPSEYSGIGD